MTPEELFYGFPNPVPDICWQLRDLVMEVAPEAVEKVRPGWRLLGFELNQTFCAVAPQRDHVRLVFERGGELDDPDGVLIGTGTQVRWMRFDALDDVDDDVVRSFVTAAVALQS